MKHSTKNYSKLSFAQLVPIVSTVPIVQVLAKGKDKQ
jgi:hypothetical protein